jgi:hypothetical protein
MRSIRFLAVAVLAIVLALSPAQVNAATLTLTPPSADATIRQSYPDMNLGPWITLDAGRFSDQPVGNLIHRSLVRFDLSSIPAGSAIISAELQLRLAGVSAGYYGTFVYVYRVTHDWVEGDGTNGVTWNEANHIAASPGSSIPWTAGGEWTTEDAASLEVLYSGGWIAPWDVTGIVQDWACGASNYGFMIRYPVGEDGSDVRFVYFDSKETENDPILTVTFEPSGGCPAAVGGVVMPANTLALVAPWLAVIGLVGCIGTVVVVAKSWKKPEN